MTAIYGLFASGDGRHRARGELLDSGAHYYDVYESLRRQVPLGRLARAQFYDELVQRSGLDEVAEQDGLGDRQDKAALGRAKGAAGCDLQDPYPRRVVRGDGGHRLCFAPVLDYDEAPAHPHNVARGTFVDYDGVSNLPRRPASAVRRAASSVPRHPRRAHRGGAHRLGLHRGRAGRPPGGRRHQVASGGDQQTSAITKGVAPVRGNRSLLERRPRSGSR